MRDRTLRLCRDVVNGVDDPDCREISCHDCMFSRGCDCIAVDEGYSEIAKKIAQEYIDKHETKKERNDKVIKTFREVVSDIKEGEVWESEFKKIILTASGTITVILKENHDGITTIGFDKNTKYALQRKQYDFFTAWNLYIKGEINNIESAITGTKWYPRNEGKEGYDYKISTKEMKNKWYINK